MTELTKNKKSIYKKYYDKYKNKPEYIKRKKTSAKKWYEKHKEEQSKRNMLYRKTHKQKIKNINTQYYQNNKKEIKVKCKIYWHKNKERLNKREEGFKIIGNKCQCKGKNCWHKGRCKVKDHDVLQFEHIYGKGGQEQKKFKGGILMLKWYIEHPKIMKKKLQVFCANCNIRKYRNELYEKSKKYISLEV